MRTVLFGLAALMTLAGSAEARDGCGRGYYYNGYRCAPIRVAPPPVYVPAPYRVQRGWAPAYVDRHGQQTFYPGPRGSCPKRYTVQDGVCKPYRGF